MKTINKHKNFLLISFILILSGSAYLFFSNDINSEKMIPVAFGSALTSSTGADVSIDTSVLDSKISSDISFLTTLVSLKKINIDTTLFTDVFFNALQNNEVRIEPVVPGRQNPFAPVESVSTNNIVSAPGVVTDEPTQVLDKTANLNGTVNVANGVGDAYFEYGLTEQNLSSKTAPVKQSLVGSFVKNISNLKPKTTYFYKACAKINNSPLCGTVVSFTTQ